MSMACLCSLSNLIIPTSVTFAVLSRTSVLQITAEQILRESQALQDQDFKPPTQKITDPTELAEYRLRKRKEFEDLVRRVRWNQSVWVKVSPRTALGSSCAVASTAVGLQP